MHKSTIYSLLIGLCFISLSCSNSKDPYADLPQHEMGKVIGEVESVPGKFGENMDGNFQLAQLSSMMEEVEKTGSYEGVIQGEIKEVCTNKGCWFSMDLPNGESMRVTFKDYGFFLPTNSQGYPIIIKGVANMVETDVETLRHFAEDQGKSEEEIAKITEPKREITFEASSAIIQEKA